MLDPQLQDKVVIVTGGNNPYGIGAATARAFAAQGARVYLHYFHTSDPEADASSTSSPGELFSRRQRPRRMRSCNPVAVSRSLGS
jgi:3-oxoacyl-[acyl-carrier protein] reductase